MIEAVAISAIIGWAFTVWRFLEYIRARDKKEEILLDRIQAPDVAVTHAFQDGDKKASIVYTGEEEDE